jgi:hypothetical protein
MSHCLRRRVLILPCAQITEFPLGRVVRVSELSSLSLCQDDCDHGFDEQMFGAK